MKKNINKLLKILFVLSISFTSIFNGYAVNAMETIKSLMEEENVEKVYSEEFTDETEAQEDLEKTIEALEKTKEEKAKDEIEFLYYVSKLEKASKTVPTTVEDFRENITKYVSTEVIKTPEELEIIKQEFIDSYKLLNDENNIYNVAITVESANNPVKVGTRDEIKTYETLDEALEAIKDTDLNYVEVYDETENIIGITVDEVCTGEEDCNNKKTELESNNNYINVNVSVRPIPSEVPTTEQVTLEGFSNQTFINDEAAATNYANQVKEAILEYIATNSKDTELQKINITTNSSLDNILTTNTEVVYQTTATNISGTFKTEEEAREAVVSYINELKETNNLVNVEKSLENVTVVDNFVEKVTVSTLFDSKEAAMAEFARLQANETNYTLKNAKVTGIDQITTSDSSSGSTGGTSTSSSTWGHLDIDATNKINIMDSDGKTVLETVTGEVTLTSVVVNGTTSISYKNKSYDSARGAWEFESQKRDLTIKSGDSVTIKGKISYTYNNEEYEFDFTYTGKILSQNNTCEGRGDAKGYDLSVSSINVTTDNKVIVEVATKWQLTYEKYNYTASVKVAEDKTTYNVVVPTMTKTTTDITYKLVGSYTQKGYDYQVTFPVDVMEDRYSFEAEISHKSKPATKEISVYSYYTQTLEILPKGGDVAPEEEAPKTGNNENYISLMVMALLVLIKKIVK